MPRTRQDPHESGGDPPHTTPGADPGETPPAAGLVCRQCGCADSRVVYVVRKAQGFVTRRRECRYCGHRFSTREIIR